jgi:hypothetical protein
MKTLIYICSSFKNNDMSNSTKTILFGTLLSIGALRVMIYREYVKHTHHYQMEIIVGIIVAIFFTTYCTIKFLKEFEKKEEKDLVE